MVCASSDFADFLEIYKDHIPTVFDRHICSELDGFYIGPCSQSRDSSILEKANFKTMTSRVLAASQHDETEIHRFGHWACGWYEMLLIHPDDTSALIVAAELSASLEHYSVLDDDAYSMAEYEAALEYWAGCRVSDRVEICQRFGLSVFAARRDEMPEDPTGELVSYLAE